MWDLRSLAFRTDLFLAGISGEVVDRGRYVVVRTPSNPDYRWGNFLLYPEPPDARAASPAGDGSWLADHARELPGVTATLFAWDRPDGARGEADRFLDQGFELDEGTILTATAKSLVRPARANDAIEVLPLSTGAHWEAAARTLTAAFTPRRSGTVDELRAFVVKQLASFRAMQDRSLGQWWGAFAEGELAGVLGLVRVGDAGDAKGAAALGRFQLIGVDPRFGRRGVCSTLVHHVARRALEEEGLSALVIAADAGYHAATVYESVGFRRTEHLVAVIKKPPQA